MERTEFLGRILDEMNDLRRNPKEFMKQKRSEKEEFGVEEAELSPLKFSEEVTEVAEECCRQLDHFKGEMTIEAARQIDYLFEQKGIWFHALGHFFIPISSTPKASVLALIHDKTVAFKGRKMNLLDPHYTLCGGAAFDHVLLGPICLLIFASDFAERKPADLRGSRPRALQQAAARRVLDGGWQGSVNAISNQSLGLGRLAARLETDVPEGTVSMKITSVTSRSKGIRVKKTRREYEIRDGRKVIEVESQEI
jgi:hypothetical protein